MLYILTFFIILIIIGEFLILTPVRLKNLRAIWSVNTFLLQYCATFIINYYYATSLKIYVDCTQRDYGQRNGIVG